MDHDPAVPRVTMSAEFRSGVPVTFSHGRKSLFLVPVYALRKSGTFEPVSAHLNQVSANKIRILKIHDRRLPDKFAKYAQR